MAAPGTRLQLRVTPGARSSRVVGRHGAAAWKVSVAAPAERGKANGALLALVSETLRVPRADVQLVAGSGARDKVVVIESLSRAQVERRLAEAVTERP